MGGYDEKKDLSMYLNKHRNKHRNKCFVFRNCRIMEES